MTKTITLNNGVKIPHLGLGVFQTDTDAATDLIYNALVAGYRLIDSAYFYKNESEVCEGIAKWVNEGKGKRSEVFYTTKIFVTDPTKGYEAAKNQIDECMKHAQPAGYIDLLLTHAPLSSPESRHGIWKAMEEAVESGKVKSIGVSNFGEQHLKELFEYKDLKIKPVVNQIELHPFFPRKKLVEYTRSLGVQVEAYSPMARGWRFGNAVVVKLAEKYRKSEGEILINWCLQKGFVALPKTATKSRLEGNLKSLDWDLSPEDVKVLDGLDEGKATAWDPTLFPADVAYDPVIHDKGIKRAYDLGSGKKLERS